MKNLLFLLIAASLLFACRGSQQAPATAVSQSLPCAAIEGLADTSDIVCGMITVPENHDEPDGRQIQIAYAILKAKSDSARNYPLIHLSGGPGGAELLSFNVEGWMQESIREDRDIILLDQRGIGLSSGLPGSDSAYFAIMAADLTAEEERIQVAELLQDLKSQSEGQGIQLEYYNTMQNARDVGALMQQLGYERYNIYGTSYGTRLGRVVQDLYPEYLNAVIYNSPNPLRGDMLIERLQSYALALERLFDYCASDSTCRAQYPDLRGDYLAAIDGIAAEPLRVEFGGRDFFVNPQDALYLIRRRLYAPDSRTAIPAMIQELRGDGGPILQQTIAMDKQLSQMINFPMWLSVERYEMYAPENTVEVIDSVYESLPLLPARMGYFEAMYRGMADWHDARLPDDQKDFQSSSVPTMIMVNRYDPVTPPENGYLFKETLPNAYLFVLDEGGHGGGDEDCRVRVMTAFMNAPGEELDFSCLNLYEQ